MSGTHRARQIAVFVAVYLLLALVPFMALNWEAVTSVYEQRQPLNPLVIAGLLVGSILVLLLLALVEEGVSRYNQFLVAPTDVLSVLVELSFLLAACSWWAVLAVSERYGWGLDLPELLTVVLVCHVPMLLFLSLMTAVGKAGST